MVAIPPPPTCSACQGVIHPATTNLTKTLSLYNRPLPPPPPPASHPQPHLPAPSGVLSPLLDSFRMKWEELPLDYHSIKGYYLD